MAKNLYNLTAVTTVNDSDLLHVNQGSVSSDKKVTKQNLLKEVNSSISSINNSLAKSYDQPTIATITIGSSGYYELSKPTTVKNKHILAISIINYSTAGGAFNVAPISDYNNTFMVFGTPNITITNLELRWVYTD